MSFKFFRDEKGCLHARPVAEEAEYESFLDCTEIPVPLRPALQEQPKPWLGGLITGATGTGKSWDAITEMLTGLETYSGELLHKMETARDEKLKTENTPAFTSSPKFVILPVYVGLRRELAVLDQDERHTYARHLKTARFAVLDDLGSERLNDFAADCLYEIIDARYRGGLPTVVTSNLTVDEIARIHGDRIMSRIASFGPVRPYRTGADLRLRRRAGRSQLSTS